MQRVRIPIVIALLSLGLSGCVDRAAQKQGRETEAFVKDPTTLVKTMTLSAVDVEDTVEITGGITTTDEVNVTAIVPGPIVSVLVEDGSEVKAGQLIALQDTSDHAARLAQAKAQMQAAQATLDQAKADAAVGPQKTAAAVKASEARLAQAKARLLRLVNGARSEERLQAEAQADRAKSDLETARLARDRARRLFEEGALSKAELERSENAYDAAKAANESAQQALKLVQSASRPEDITAAEQDVRAAEQQLAIDQANKRLDVLFGQRVESAQANLTAAQETMRLAQIAYDNTRITSPFAGRVSGRPLQPGAYAAPGVPIAKIVGVEGSYFEAEVPEKTVGMLTNGARVEVRVDALGDQVLTGRISAVNPRATDVGRLFLVRVSLDSRPPGLKAGMFARGQVTVGSRTGVHMVPSEAVVRSGSDTFIYVEDGGKAKRVAVKTGQVRDGMTEIEGAQDGLRVIVQGQGVVSEGSPIKEEGQGAAEAEPTADEAGA